ncbi:hypothetical protein MWU75_06525 [Ornithinimicrobium sp. F0845]|uniref:hypothetical protein n=1 Tax=Ornithinimicrobium sp. F0845 TaxID=2926412 RepID=UPI001FF6188C|nr:hypothetical protein [Ornithinimicrobium sp. F0845]MCK0111790.1 hypothetical protein [Ornithinimicrobium sp. F0845]
MATTTVAPEGVGTSHRSLDAWQLARWLVLGLYAVTVVTTALTGFRLESYDDLRSGLERGAVTQVRVVGAVGAPQSYTEGVVGASTVRLEWREGWHRSSAEVLQSNSVDELRSQGFDPRARDFIIGDVTDALRQSSPDVEVVWATPSDGIYTTVGGWELRGAAGYLMGLLLISFLLLVLNSPQPRLATRWAWVWFALSPAMVVAVPVFLLIGARGQVPGRWRLPGVGAFLIAVLLL